MTFRSLSEASAKPERIFSEASAKPQKHRGPHLAGQKVDCRKTKMNGGFLERMTATDGLIVILLGNRKKVSTLMR